MLSKSNLVLEIKKKLPSIQIDEEFQDILLVVSQILSDFIVKEEKSNSKISHAVVDFINELVESKNDDDISYFLTETILNLYDDREIFRYQEFKKRLSPKAQAHFDFTVSSWLGSSK